MFILSDINPHTHKLCFDSDHCFTKQKYLLFIFLLFFNDWGFTYNLFRLSITQYFGSCFSGALSCSIRSIIPCDLKVTPTKAGCWFLPDSIIYMARVNGMWYKNIWNQYVTYNVWKCEEVWNTHIYGQYVLNWLDWTGLCHNLSHYLSGVKTINLSFRRVLL